MLNRTHEGHGFHFDILEETVVENVADEGTQIKDVEIQENDKASCAEHSAERGKGYFLTEKYEKKKLPLNPSRGKKEKKEKESGFSQSSASRCLCSRHNSSKGGCRYHLLM